VTESQTQAQQANELLITRVFDAPLDKVWKAWTDPDEIKKWWGPAQFTAPSIENDFRVGGKYLYSMRGPDGQEYWSTGVYREIVPMERIVVTDSFADENGNVVPASHYGMTDFPMETEITVTFADLDGKTELTLKHSGMPAGEMGEQAEAGWNQSLDKFAEAIR
jgi:uncharacterized protein YndB with AHSA1/START domain